MSIASRQVKKELNRIVEDRMRDGYIPTIEYTLSKLALFYSRVSVGTPSLLLRKQLYRKLWDIDIYNKNLNEIYDDINNLYEEMIDQFSVVLTDFDYYETERKKLLHEINEQNGILTDLTLAAADTEGYLYSVHDDFIDRSKINLKYTTCEINTDGGIITLRESRHGIRKLDMSHYFDTINYPILAEKQYAENIVSNKLFAGSKFGYIFSDINTSWIQNIVSKSGGELVLSFIVDISPNREIGEYISRVEMLGQTSSPMWVEPLWSLDNINFKTIPMGNGPGKKSVSDGKKTVWNFQDLRCRYIKFMITKDMEDDTVGSADIPLYRYVVGFKHVEIFKMAYDKSSDLYSKVYQITDPTGELLTIDKAALVIDHDIHPGTSVEYFLSLGTEGEQDPSQYNWIPVSPLNDLTPSEQQVVDFRHVAFFNNVPEIQWDSGSYGTALEAYNGIDFYKIYEFPYEPVRDSITLYRGKDNWQVEPKYEVRRIAEYDEEHAFGSGNVITLNNPDFTIIEGEGLIRGSIVVKTDPGTNPDYEHIYSSDYTIDYNNKTITRTTGSNISDDPNAPRNTVYVDYQYDSETAEPTVYTTYIYILNPDGIDVNIVPFSPAEIEAGQFTYITTSEGLVDLSAETSYHISQGWHKVSTTAEPRSASDRFYSVNDSKYLYEKVYSQYAYADKLQEVSWFELKHVTRKLDHSKYCVVDYDGDGNKEIIVNYRPQTAAWSNSNDNLLCPGGTAESYVLSYKFISAAADTIYFKASFSRDENVSPLLTPTLRSYIIKLGY